MQIQWCEGAAPNCAEAVPQSATRDCMSRKLTAAKKDREGRGQRGWKRRFVPRQDTEVWSRSEHVFELENVVSCRSREHRWRTKLDFSSGESFDDRHRPTTLGARPKIARTGGGGRLLGLRCRTEQLETKWQVGGTFAIGQEAEVSDAHEPFGEQMQQEATQKFIDR
jgi:hypothetical protein